MGKKAGQFARPSMTDADKEMLTAHVRMVEVAFMRGNFSHARDVVDAAEKEFARPPDSATLQSSIHDIGLEVRVANALYNIEVRTVASALDLSRERFVATPNLGSAHWKGLIDCLASNGFEHGETQ